MGSLRITSGRWRGRSVTVPPGEGTRPLLTRVRKSLVDILRPRLADARILDLFGGSGAIALELLSNGARQAVVYELDAQAAELIVENAARLGADVQVRVGDALGLLRRETGTFDVVVVAPPYGEGLQQATLNALAARPELLRDDGLIIVQREQKEPEGLPPPGLLRTQLRRYGRTIFEFYRAV